MNEKKSEGNFEMQIMLHLRMLKKYIDHFQRNPPMKKK